MKLQSLYIENFGGLHQYALEFRPDLTEIYAPNGYGKTTLAEFIRAMFYGFPRKGRSLEKSRRQKYLPWQGGKFGGSLVFETDGSRYRIERTFGSTPKGDTFALFDLATGKRTGRFTENIGLELFQLDGESFERSTYMPQFRELGELTTDSIQAKLSNLVEASEDLGNFEDAVAALRTSRSGFVPSRGTGGTVAKARAQVIRLQTELEMLEKQVMQEACLRDAVNGLEEKQEQIRSRRAEIRSLLDKAAARAMAEAAHREYQSLLEQQTRTEKLLEELQSAYPAGVPSEKELNWAGKLADRQMFLTEREEPDEEERSARDYLEENRIFLTRMPDQKELDACRAHISGSRDPVSAPDAFGLGEEERRRYDMLCKLEAEDGLNPRRLEELSGLCEKLETLRWEQSSPKRDDPEKTEWNRMQQYFHAGVPEEEEIRFFCDCLDTAAQIRRKLHEPAWEKNEGKVPSSLWLWALLLTALSALGAGLWMIVVRDAFWGWAVLAMAAGLAAGGSRIYGARRQQLEKIRNLRKMREDTRRCQEQQAAAMERETAEFAELYTQTTPISDALEEIRRNRLRYLTLREQLHSRADTQTKQERMRQKLQDTLYRELGTDDFRKAILDLHLARQELANLRQKYRAGTENKLNRERERAEHRKAAETFLRIYYDIPEGADLEALMSELQNRMNRYGEARRILETRARQRDQRNRELEQIGRELADFFGAYKCSLPEDIREGLNRIRDDCRNMEILYARLEDLRGLLQNCINRYPEELAQPMSEPVEDSVILRREAEQLRHQAEETGEQLLQLRQNLAGVRAQMERIPGVKRELDFWQTRCREDQKKAELLDETIACLGKAREQLQSNYLGPLRHAFHGYMEELAGEEPSKILMTPDFQIRLERQGQVRELGFFSAGQADMVTLCMRFALVDALFRAEKPFVILDDPFINLDDENTGKALDLLRTLSRDRQIIYISCNSSRKL